MMRPEQHRQLLTPRIALGVFAHNEERNIERTLHGLARQTLLHGDRSTETTLYVLANGCTDGTVTAAREALERCMPTDQTRWHAEVEAIALGGKSRTWNHFVHRLLPDSAEYVLFTDADIEFPDVTTLADVVDYLDANPAVQVATSRATKSTELKRTWNPMDWLSARASKMSQSRAQHAIAGSLYCMRASLARRIVLPNGLLVEDGFVRIAASTDGFSAEPNDNRIQRVPGARHVFHPCRGVIRNLRHERRLVIGTLQNFAIWDWIRAQPSGTNVADLIRRMNETDDNWTHPIAQSHAERVGRRGALKMAWARAIGPLRSQGLGRRLLMAPIALARLVFSGSAGVAAIGALTRRELQW